MTRRLLLTYVTITAVALLVLVVPLGLTFARRERDRLYFDLERDASAVASLSEDALEAGTTPPVDDVLADYRARTAGRILVVDQRGITVADSDLPGGEPRDYSTRPEIATALEGERAIGTRPSDTLGTGLVFVAIPVTSGGAVHGAVRVTFATASLDARVRRAWLWLGALSGVVLAAVAVVGLVLARGVTRPVRDLERVAERIAGGDLSARAGSDRGPPELRRLASTFNDTAGRLEQLVNAQQRFVADAAHQLRTPLTALRLRIENLEAVVPAEQRPALGAAVGEVGRLSRIIDGLLLLARIDARQPPLERVDLTPIVLDRVDAWAGTAAEGQASISTDLPEHAWVAVPDGTLEQVIDNLVSNALAVAPPGSTVAVSVRTTDAGVELHVVDAGPGLSDAERTRAFERFWRGAAVTPGTGLGLPIVRQLVRLAGGEAALEPGPGGMGTDAVVRLPVAPGGGHRGPAARPETLTEP